MKLTDASGVTLAYVEFDDNGELFERDQLNAAVSELARVVKAPSGADVVVFIHGWKNDADNSSNVSGFQRFLKEIRKTRAQRPLVGIYLAWRGSSLKLGQNLTSWNRSLAATRIGGPHLEETLFQITNTAKGPRGDNSSTLVVIGHSFGGRVLEHALTPYLETLMLQAMSGDKLRACVEPQNRGSDRRTTVHAPLPDLALLLNEAAPATDAKALLETLTCHNVRYERRSPDTNQRVSAPLLLSVTSDGDAATGVALPGAQWLGRSQLKTRSYDPPKPDRPWEGPAEIGNQSTYYTHTTAHIPALHSHAFQQAACTGPVDFGAGPDIRIRSQLDPYYLCPVGTVHNPKAPRPYWNHTPYWVFKMPIEIVPNHTDIFRDELFDLVTFLLPAPGTVGELTLQ